VRGGVVVRDVDGQGAAFVAAMDALFRKGPPKVAQDELLACRVWAQKMLVRVRQGDIEAHFRRAWLLNQLLEDYFRARSTWYLGPKESLAWLRTEDPQAFQAFGDALRPGAPVEALDVLVSTVWRL
jgi:hypothetical protein